MNFDENELPEAEYYENNRVKFVETKL